MAKGWKTLIAEAHERARKRKVMEPPKEQYGPDLSDKLRGVKLQSEEFEIHEGRLTRKLHD